MGRQQLLEDGPPDAPVTIALAHGAGVGMNSEFMVAFTEGLSTHGYRVVRFEFPYMAERKRTGKNKPPDRQPVLEDTWLEVLDSLDSSSSTIIGGKSMGGRIASLIADERDVLGLVCLGYPFHPPGKPDRLRIEHLKSIKTPTLILQGERDSLGNRDEVAGYELSNKVQVKWLPDGDHSFKPRKRSGRTQDENWRDAIQAIVQFVDALRG
jgi:predicted alpha/beta-hydrolase family hydrolase